MLSWPPAITTSASPQAIARAASCTAASPEPHTLFNVMAATPTGKPALSAVWRAVFCPAPAVNTCPISTSSTLSAATPVSANNCLITVAPKSTALTDDKLPIKAPMGVRRAATLTTSCMFSLPILEQDTRQQAGVLHFQDTVYPSCLLAFPPPLSLY